MRKINIANAKKRDAQVGFESKTTKPVIKQVLKSGAEKRNVKILKSSLSTDFSALLKKYKDLENFSQAIINSDIEWDIETAGMVIDSTKKIYVNKESQIVFNVKLLEVIKDVNGSEKARRPYVQKDANISVEKMPVLWSNKSMPKKNAVKKFVFSRHYQIKHTNGITYDFLYAMAKELDDAKSLMFVGAGSKGNLPLVSSTGGIAYRGFLEGRINGDKYSLNLHLTNFELKEPHNG